MDSPQKKLPSTMDGKTPHLLPVTASVAVGVAKQNWRVSFCAFLNAFVFLGFRALGLAIYYVLKRCDVLCSQSSFILRCYQLTDAEAAEEAALRIVMVCCAAFQLAAAPLALRRRCSRRRDLALALTIVGHCMYAAVVRLYMAANPGDFFYWIFCTVAIAFFALGDIVSLLAIVRGGGPPSFLLQAPPLEVRTEE